MSDEDQHGSNCPCGWAAPGEPQCPGPDGQPACMSDEPANDRQEVARKSGVYWDNTVIVVELTTTMATELLHLCMNNPRAWNSDIRTGIQNLIDGAPSLFDRYSPENPHYRQERLHAHVVPGTNRHV